MITHFIIKKHIVKHRLQLHKTITVHNRRVVGRLGYNLTKNNHM
jgi:hypothetical protein